ncbi:hypothetical protein J0X15_12485 [Roseibium sp. CAU 1637]|uniref:Uncharacterized protein n=1 Tax=Roseibium limicola TaxID=2816037 RepID=A0A939J7C9_9HYPH|nr:hypothetical protein [Roseibium limicola]MBO0346042.1 hypothetical protein [Roseibium limicola]
MTYEPRTGGRYIRDPKTGERVREEKKPGRLLERAEPAADALDPRIKSGAGSGSRDAASPHAVRDDGGVLGAATPKPKPSRKKNPKPKASQGQAAVAVNAAPRLEDSATRGTSVKTS